MTTSIFIDGAEGTTGLEIRERLSGREEFALTILDDASRKDIGARKDALQAADIAILCLPDAAARESVTLAEGSNTRIIDASSAHRVADGWTYGFPELVGQETVAEAQYVSNPGCYPTGFIALIAPLVREGIIPADWPYTVNAVSGYSGGGKALIERFGKEPDIAFRSYSHDLAHKHLPEMQARCGLEHTVLFAPSVVPAFRGMHVEVPLHLGAMSGNPTADALKTVLAEHYAGSKVVRVSDDVPAEMLLNEGSQPHDGMTLFVCGNEGGWNARLIAQLDNLGKGASGAAIQNLNLMCGLEETTGLAL